MALDQIQSDALEKALFRGPRTGEDLCSFLGISQSTLSRAIQAEPEKFSLLMATSEHTPSYGLLRSLPAGVSPRQTVYQVSRQGKVEKFARLEFLSGGATFEQRANRNTLYSGLPPYMAFAAPSGFLGRKAAQEMIARMRFPINLNDWSDDHRISYLFCSGVNLAGNLIFGEHTLQWERRFCTTPTLDEADKLKVYCELAHNLTESSCGSGVGGEQPKFMALLEGKGHVIVKFAKSGSRMADLLALEATALRCLEAVGVPSARASVLASNEYVFLEVQRFDRQGRHGRTGMLSAGSIDDEHFGSRDTWSEFATRCVHAKLLETDDVRLVNTMAAFSELIGNGDRHFENISVLRAQTQVGWGIAPAYDILPMRYAPGRGGVDPELRPISPQIGKIGTQPEVWARAYEGALMFWEAVRSGILDHPVSEGWSDLADKNLVVMWKFVEPLLPDCASV